MSVFMSGLLRRDRVVQAALFIFCATAIGSLASGSQSEEWMQWRPLLNVFLALSVVALLLGLRDLQSAAERRFWRALVCAYGVWCVASFATAIPWISKIFGAAIVANFALLADAFYYIAWIVATEQSLERRTSDDGERSLHTPTIPIFVVGLVVYFKLLPLFSSHAAEETAATWLYLTLDAYLLARISLLAAQAATVRWRTIFAILSIYFAAMTISNFLATTSLGPVWLWKPQFLFLWISPHLLLIFAARARRRLPELDPEDLAPKPPPGTGWQTMICGLMLPLIHSVLYGAHLLAAEHLDARHLWIVVWLSLIGGVGLLQNRRYEQHRRRSEESRLALVEKLARRKGIEAERERFIRELQEKNQEMDRFTSTVAHDLKAPLFTLEGFVGFLERDIEKRDVSRIETDLRKIYEAIHGMRDLLVSLLALARAGKVVDEPQPIDLAELVPQAIERVRGRIDQREIEVRIPSDLPVVLGDSGRLLEVFQNLLDNAAKYMGEDQDEPRIDLSWRRVDDGVVVSVRDNGRGIDPESQERVFETFYGDRQAVDSNGLGLALVRRIISAHQGTIWVESNEPEEGTTFFILLRTEPA